MKVLLQRVSAARVDIEGQCVGAIGRGLLLFVGVEREDTREITRRMAERLLTYRVFSDDSGRMNRSVADIRGELLVVSQFTLAADTHKGRRPSFSTAAAPALAESLYVALIDHLRAASLVVQSGQFAADMQVSLCNDGPVTFLLEV